MIGEMKAEELAGILSVHAGTITDWTKNKRAELTEQRNQKILNLYLRAENTQEKVAEIIDMTQPRIKQILENFINNNKFIEIYKTFNPFIYNIWNLQKKLEVVCLN